MKTDLLLGIAPYAAIVIGAGGLAVRLATARGPSNEPSEPAKGRLVLLGGRAWRISLLAILCLHLAGVLVPRAVLAWNSVPVRLYLLEGSGFLLGAIVLGAWVDVMWRHVITPSSSIRSALGDSILLGLLLVALASGFAMQAFYRWGSSWGVATLTPYVLSILRGRPAVELVAQMPFLVRLHVVSCFAVVAALPFSGLATPIDLAARRAVARASVVLRALALSLGAASAKQWAVDWLWPEEDTDTDLNLPETWVPTRSDIVLSPAPRGALEAEATYETTGKAG